MGVRTVSVPFDIAAEYVPALLRDSDDKLMRLTAGLPPESPEFDRIIGRSPSMDRARTRARRIAPHDVTVLIEGESGTGKELFARAIHAESRRSREPTRDLHPRTTIETGTPASPCWADGSAAWTYLHNNARRDLIHEVSNWLAQEDRLDTGYALQTQCIVEVPEDAPIVSLVREYQQLREEFGTTEGGIDLDEWADRQAKNLIDSIRRHRADQVARELLQGFSVENCGTNQDTREGGHLRVGQAGVAQHAGPCLQLLAGEVPKLERPGREDGAT